MSKKDFVALARLIKETSEHPNSDIESYGQAVTKLADGIADICQRHNPEFNRTLFLRACGRGVETAWRS